METMLAIFGAKWCCVFASTLGGLTNGLVHKWMGWLWERFQREEMVDLSPTAYSE